MNEIKINRLIIVLAVINFISFTVFVSLYNKINKHTIKKYQLLALLSYNKIIFNIDGQPLIGKTFPNFQIGAPSHGDTVQFAYLKTRYKIVILFSPHDCESCLLESSFWEYLYSSQRDITVYAVAHSCTKDELDKFIKHRAISLPILHDINSIIKKKLKIVYTPLKLVLDSQNKIIYTQLSSYDQDQQKAFSMLISRLLKREISVQNTNN